MSTTDSLKPTERFSSRVADYVRYRPDYPPALLSWARARLNLTPTIQIADIGAGTGIASQLWLDAGHAVIAVEPNAAMRAAAEARLGECPRFRTVDGRADATGLASASVDLVTVAQAFHWFDRAAAHREFARILKPMGAALIFSNIRRLHGTPFLEGYEALLQAHCPEYGQVTARYADDAAMQTWFGAGLIDTLCIEHRQRLDFENLRGRLLSSSYAPQAGQSGHEAMLSALRELFEACQRQGLIDFDYDTRAFAGRMI